MLGEFGTPLTETRKQGLYLRIFLFILFSLTPMLLIPSGFLYAFVWNDNLKHFTRFYKRPHTLLLHLVAFSHSYNSIKFKPLYLKLTFRYIVLFSLYLDILVHFALSLSLFYKCLCVLVTDSPWQTQVSNLDVSYECPPRHWRYRHSVL